MLIHHDDCGLQLITDEGFSASSRQRRDAAAVRDRVLHERRRRRPPVDRPGARARRSCRTATTCAASSTRSRPALSARSSLSGRGRARRASRARRQRRRPSTPRTAHDHDRQPVGLCRADEVGRGRELVGDRDLRRAQRHARRGRACRAGRAAARARRRRSRRRSCPCRNGRPNESVTITATSTPVCSREPVADPPRARIRVDREQDRPCPARPRSSGRRRPRRRRIRAASRRSRARRASGRSRAVSRQDHLELRGGRSPARRARARAATARPRRGGRRGPRPSTRPSARRRRRRRPRSSVAAAISAPRSSPSRISGRPSTGMISITRGDAGDADPGVRLVAAVQVHDHRRQPLERPRARERARIERAAGDELRGELERELLRVGVVAADERVLLRRRLVEVRGGDRVEPRDDRAGDDVLDPLGERARVRVGPDAALARTRGRSRPRSSGVAPSAPAISRAVSSAASALTASTARSTPRDRVARSSAPRRPAPSSAAAAPRTAASREPITTSSSPSATRRAASARPKLPVPPRIATLTRRPPAASSTARASRRRASVVGHQRPRDDRAHAVGQLGRARPPRRSRARRSGPGSTPATAAGRRAAGEAREHAVGGPLDGAAADQRADRDARHAPPLERGADLRRPRGSARSRRTGCWARSRSRRRRSIASTHAGRRARLGRAGVVHARRPRRGDRARRTTSWNGNVPAGVSMKVRSGSSVAGSSVQRSPNARASRAVASESGTPSRSSCVRTRCRPMSRSPSRNHASPPSAADGRERVPGLVGAPPAALLVGDAGERVEDAVEIGRDVQAEHLDVVAHVAYDGYVVRFDYRDDAAQEPRAADAAREHGRPSRGGPAGAARRARCARPRAEPLASRSRSATVSTSSIRFGASTVRDGRERGEPRGAAGPVDRGEQVGRRRARARSSCRPPPARARGRRRARRRPARAGRARSRTAGRR